MKSLIEWLDEGGFIAKDVWDIPTGTWIHEAPLQIFPHQREIFAHVFTPDAKGRFPYTDIVYSAPKKSGKTLVEALITGWAGECAIDGSEIYLCANDLDQATARGFTDLEYHTIHQLGISASRNRITYLGGSFVQTLAQHYASASGSRPFLSCFDELWAFMSERSRRMWAEMTPPPSVENAMRLVVTYAGFEQESDQLYELYNLCFRKDNGEYVAGEVVPELAHIVDDFGDPVCRRNGRTFIYWDTKARMPWQTPEYYESQLQTLRPSDFLRMHKNKWVSSNESFIPIELYDNCVRKGELQNLMPMTMDVEHPYRFYPIALAIDIGTKHDTSALVGTYYDYARKVCGVAFHKIFTPPKGATLDIEETVEKYVFELYRMKLNITAILYDPYMMARTAVTFAKSGLPVVEFPQTISNMTAATGTLYDLLHTSHLEVYKSDDLRDHIRYSVAETSQRGFRLVKGGRNSIYPIDAAVALAMSCYWSVKFGGTDTSAPIIIESPFSDATAIHRIDEAQLVLPEALRD